MPFPILTSLVALPTIGALVLLFVRNDEQNDAPGPRRGADRVAARLRGDAPAVGPVQPGVGGFPVRGAPRVDPGVRHQLRRRRRRHQPAAPRADWISHAARAPRLVGVGAQEDEGILHVRAAPRERDDGRLRVAGFVPVLRLLGRDAHPDVFPHRNLGLRPPRLRRDQVHALHDGGQCPHAAGHPGPCVPALHGDRRATAST